MTTGLIVLAILLVVGSIVLSVRQKDGFRSNNDLASPGDFPKEVDLPLLAGYFPYTGHKYSSNDQGSRIWWHYPIFTEGSYAQITNNLRYPNNPDNGTCTPADVCGALYRDKKKNPSNYLYPLPPAVEGPGARVNYYRTEPNLLTMSIDTNENVLY